MSDLGSSISTLFFPMLDSRAVASVIQYLKGKKNDALELKKSPDTQNAINRPAFMVGAAALGDIRAALDEKQSVTLNKKTIFINHFNGTYMSS